MAYEIKEYLAHRDTYTRGNNGRHWIVVHYTATQASAYNNCVYFSGGNRSASAHYFIDDTSIWRSVPESDTAWHAGNWQANTTSIGIEVVSDGRDYSEAEISRLAWLVQDLMRRYGIDANHVIRHYDVADHFSGGTKNPHKLCPAPYINAAKWASLKARITGGQSSFEEEPEVITDQDLDNIADRVWNKHYNGASMGGKLAGADSAANWTKNAIENHQVAADAALAVWSFKQNGKQMRDVVWDASWWTLYFAEHTAPTLVNLATAIAQRIGANTGGGNGQSISSN